MGFLREEVSSTSHLDICVQYILFSTVYSIVYSLVDSVLYNTVYITVYSTVYSIVWRVKNIVEEACRACSVHDIIGQPFCRICSVGTTVLYTLQYTVQYKVCCT